MLGQSLEAGKAQRVFRYSLVFLAVIAYKLVLLYELLAVTARVGDCFLFHLCSRQSWSDLDILSLSFRLDNWKFSTLSFDSLDDLTSS